MKIKYGESFKSQNFPSLVKFLDLNKFLDFLVNANFHFTRLDHFEDKMEGISQSQLSKYLQYKLKLPKPTRLELKLSVRQKRYFASCWFSGQRESISMWNLYSNSSSIALKIDFEKFKQILDSPNITIQPNMDWINSIHVDKIHYKNYLNKKSVENFNDEGEILGFHKDECYSHEQEVRILIKSKNKYEVENKSYQPDKIHFYKFKPMVKLIKNEVPMKVIFHPHMNHWQKENIKKLINGYRFKNITTQDSELTKFFLPLK